MFRSRVMYTVYKGECQPEFHHGGADTGGAGAPVPEGKIMSKDAQLALAMPGRLVPVAGLNRAQAEPVPQPAAAGAGAPQALELPHLRYFVALADAGSFHRAPAKI